MRLQASESSRRSWRGFRSTVADPAGASGQEFCELRRVQAARRFASAFSVLAMVIAWKGSPRRLA